MSMKKIARDMREGVFPRKSEQKVQGISRMADNNQALLISMAVEPTDDEIRELHDYLREWHSR